MARGTFQRQGLAIALASFFGYFNLALAVEILRRNCVGLQHLCRSALEYDFATFSACSGADIHNIVSLKHYILVMLNHYYRIHGVAQALQ